MSNTSDSGGTTLPTTVAPSASSTPPVQPAPAATAADPFGSIFADMKAEILKEYPINPNNVGSARVQSVISYQNLQQQQQMLTQLTTIAAAFNPPTPAKTPLEGFGHAAAGLMHAFYAPVADIQNQLNGHNDRLGASETLQGQLSSQIEAQSKQADANFLTFSREMTAFREAVKELKDSHHADRQKLAKLEQAHKNTVQLLQTLQSLLAKTIRHVEGWDERLWEELEKSLNRHSEILIVEREPPQDDPRRPHKGTR